LSATSAAAVAIRDTVPDDAVAACHVLRESISRLCIADHRNDPAILNAWLANAGDRGRMGKTTWKLAPDAVEG
jgi:hypothetical protein